MIEIYFIRHGQASFGKPVYDCLSPTGKIQSQLLGIYLNKSGIHFDAVYSGSLKRQLKTATIALGKQFDGEAPDIQIDQNFNEFESSDQMMNRLYHVIHSDAELAAKMRTIHTNRDAVGQIIKLADRTQTSLGNEEERLLRMDAFRKRVTGAINNLVSVNGHLKKVAVFTSGGPTTVALRQALETSREQTLRLNREIRNSSVTVLRYVDRQPTLVLFNSIAHLEIQKDPNLITYI